MVKKGRPSKYSAQVQKHADNYLDDFKEHGHAVPSITGLAEVLKLSVRTLHTWANEKPDFLHTLERIKNKQELELINQGLTGGFNASIVKLMLANYGYSDKQQNRNDTTIRVLRDQDMATMTDQELEVIASGGSL